MEMWMVPIWRPDVQDCLCNKSLSPCSESSEMQYLCMQRRYLQIIQSHTEICTNRVRWLLRSVIQWMETWQIAYMKCRTGRPLTFNCSGTIKGWWTRCMYGTSWFTTCSHSCLFNLLTYLLWSSASTVVNNAADNHNREGGIEDVHKRPP